MVVIFTMVAMETLEWQDSVVVAWMNACGI
jgi:hypothetical protein